VKARLQLPVKRTAESRREWEGSTGEQGVSFDNADSESIEDKVKQKSQARDVAQMAWRLTYQPMHAWVSASEQLIRNAVLMLRPGPRSKKTDHPGTAQCSV
jgi:hypothetical protein